MQVVKTLPANAGNRRPGFDPWVGKISRKRKQLPTPVFLPGGSQRLGAWRATVHRVTKSQTRLKRLSMPHDIHLKSTHTDSKEESRFQGCLVPSLQVSVRGIDAANLQLRLHLRTQDQRCSKPANSGQEFRQRRAFVQWHHKGKSPVDEPRARQKRERPRLQVQQASSSTASSSARQHVGGLWLLCFPFFLFNWNTVDFPCCVNFCYPAK